MNWIIKSWTNLESTQSRKHYNKNKREGKGGEGGGGRGEEKEKEVKNYKHKKAPEKLSKMARKFKLDRMEPSKMWSKFKNVVQKISCSS